VQNDIARKSYRCRRQTENRNARELVRDSLNIRWKCGNVNSTVKHRNAPAALLEPSNDVWPNDAGSSDN
jgi:hypothetical protein